MNGGWESLRQRAWEREEWKLIVGIAFGTVPPLVVGFLLKDVMPESPAMIAILSIIMALLLGLAEKIGRHKRSFDSLQIKDGILVGLGQTLALLPGVSRSGSTLTIALFLGLERQTAARFSFLLGHLLLLICCLAIALFTASNHLDFRLVSVSLWSINFNSTCQWLAKE